MDTIEIIVPKGADESRLLDFCLVNLTRAIDQLDSERVAHGFLGGEHGYGANWDNEVFTMRPFYWGDCDCGWEQLSHQWSEDNEHADDCYWTVSHRLIDSSPLQAEREAAIDARNKHSFMSKKSEAAQKVVEDVCNRLDAYEEQVRRELCRKHNIPWNKGLGCAVHCTCDHDRLWKEFYEKHGGHKPTCALELPNFHHKASGLTVTWYKYIGRDMKMENPNGADVAAVFRECMESLRAG